MQSCRLAESAGDVECELQGMCRSADGGQNEFSGQLVHWSAPVDGLYVPPGQIAQALMFPSVYPGRQLQKDGSGDLAGAMECVGHSLGVAVASGQ